MEDAGRKSIHDPPPFTAAQRRYLAVKRCLDAVLAALLLAVLALPMGLIAAALWLSDPRAPVFFRQQRVGRGGALFTLWKFRSMDRAGRATAFGRYLRAASLDELPQLAQVLTGRMSLIGPRPLVPEETAIHAMRMAAGVYRLRPGMSGLAQVSGRDRMTDTAKAAYDRQYMQRLSFRQDWRIFWLTLIKVLRRDDIADR